MTDLSYKNNMSNFLFGVYLFVLFCITPFVVTPFRKEMFYDGKLVFVVVSTLVYLFILIYNWVRDKNSLNFNKINYSRYELVIGFFALLAILSTIFSVDLSLSLWGQPHSREGLLSILAYVVIFCIFYRGFTFSRSLFVWILVSASLVSIYGILQYYRIAPGLHEFVKGVWEQGLTTIGNRNFVGTYALLMLTVAVGMVLQTGEQTGGQSPMSRFAGTSKSNIISYIIASCIIFGLLVASMTRSAWIGFAIVFALYFIFSIKSKDMLVRWAILLVLFAGIFGVMNTSKDSQVKERAKTIVEDVQDIKNDSVGSYRMYYWKRTRAIMLDRPWLGSGPDTYGEVFKDEYGEDKIKLHYEKAHNEYLQIAMTLGYPALGLYLALVMMVLWGLIKVMRRGVIWQGDRRHGFIAPMVFCCIVGYLVQAFFNISVISTAPMYWAMLGIGARIGEGAQ